ncbi:30S ribosomal protein S20 [Candidatus Kaiserbacteria bacterium CG10_big_fil_rev_8_21_14_0_10_59_10]|uniref:Small ribosomal subunit protein bS20 n=1 Tax=Candidatus Kaiserbacteria bacterium CG10_big_fil_rev_8_21_14_0_10_59_10 TaxID=1974612 RepID=A0A2H0U9Y7_9BACT|nr:MAG: 30S ribosomal protein S20 [Candidatus Kaiserbacteria bacterium CG10_big_fil_rev_8_21_14_0_10_59_10]
MAITSSAKKALRVAKRRTVFNTRRKAAVKSSVKTISKLVAAKQSKEAEAALPNAYKAIDKATKRGILKPNTAARMKSRLAKQARAAA